MITSLSLTRSLLKRSERKLKACSKSIDILTLSVELWMYRDMIRANVEKYCMYNGEIKCPLKEKEYLDIDENINNKEKEKNKEKKKNKNFKAMV